MKFKRFLILMTMFCIACSSVEIENTLTNTPSFVTATLPPTSASQATQTLSLLPTSPAATNTPIEGTTTTQINLRTKTTTASQSLGVIPAFTKIQIIGKESSGNWYKIIYNESTGWARAEFVQTESSDMIAVVEIEPSGGSNRSAVVISGINVRSGAGTQFESIGVLTAKDVVIILAKNTSGSWVQIDFEGNIGWVAAEFLQIENVEEIPVINEAQIQNTPSTHEIETAIATPQISALDYDTIENPSFKMNFVENSFFQVTGVISSSQGDNEDWIEFSTFSSSMIIEMLCSDASLQIEVWQTDVIVNQISSPCNNRAILNSLENQSYTFRIFESDKNKSMFTSYTLKVQIGN